MLYLSNTLISSFSNLLNSPQLNITLSTLKLLTKLIAFPYGYNLHVVIVVSNMDFPKEKKTY